MIVALFCLRISQCHPRDLLGFWQDDTIYFTSAKALAEGSGYTIPSFPGTLPQTKYPILYPLALSLAWRIAPHFPQSFMLAICISVAIAITFLLLSYKLLRQGGSSSRGSLAVVFAVAIHPAICFMAAQLLSDFLFAVLILASIIATNSMCSSEKKEPKWGILLGVLLGLSMLTRTAAVGAVAGLVTFMLFRRRWHGGLLALVGCGVLHSIGTLATAVLFPTYVPAGSGAQPTSFTHVLTFYSSYVKFWSSSVPNWSVLWGMVIANLQVLLLAPGNYFVMAGRVWPSNLFFKIIALVVTACSLSGVIRWGRVREQSICFALVGSVPILLFWNGNLYDRFLLPFVPILFMGLFLQLRRCTAAVISAVSRGGYNKLITLSSGLAIVTFLLVSGCNYYLYAKHIAEEASRRAELNVERREAYDWINRHAALSSRIVAYEDGLLYLHTGRQSIRPAAPTTDCLYDRTLPRCVADYDEMGTWLDYAGTQYWLVDPLDFHADSYRQFLPEVRQYYTELQRRMTPVFVSTDGRVVLYDTTCLINDNSRSCTHYGSVETTASFR
jgi:hypothetical protein